MPPAGWPAVGGGICRFFGLLARLSEMSLLGRLDSGRLKLRLVASVRRSQNCVAWLVSRKEVEVDPFLASRRWLCQAREPGTRITIADCAVARRTFDSTRLGNERKKTLLGRGLTCEWRRERVGSSLVSLTTLHFRVAS